GAGSRGGDGGRGRARGRARPRGGRGGARIRASRDGRSSAIARARTAAAWVPGRCGRRVRGGGPRTAVAARVLPPLGEQAHRAAAGELVERDLGLPVAGVAGGEIEAAGSLAVVAARPAALGPTCHPLAPRGEVAACGVGAEQRARRRAVLAERVVGDLEPVVAVAAAGGRFVLRRQ